MLATAHAEPFENLHSFLEQNLRKELLRFTTWTDLAAIASLLVATTSEAGGFLPARMGRGFGHRFLYGCLLLTIALPVFWSWTPSNFFESFFKA